MCRQCSLRWYSIKMKNDWTKHLPPTNKLLKRPHTFPDPNKNAVQIFGWSSLPVQVSIRKHTHTHTHTHMHIRTINIHTIHIHTIHIHIYTHTHKQTRVHWYWHWHQHRLWHRHRHRHHHHQHRPWLGLRQRVIMWKRVPKDNHKKI
jgi:hypothetical protein